MILPKFSNTELNPFTFTFTFIASYWPCCIVLYFPEHDGQTGKTAAAPRLPACWYEQGIVHITRVSPLKFSAG